MHTTVIYNIKSILYPEVIDMPYRVKATFRGKRIATDMVFGTKAEAEKYARETNRNFRGANARVAKV